MSKVYISVRKAGIKPGQNVVLELSSSQAAKSAYQAIKTQLPKASLGVFGARDLATFRRTQRNLKGSRVVHSVSELIESVEPSGAGIVK